MEGCPEGWSREAAGEPGIQTLERSSHSAPLISRGCVLASAIFQSIECNAHFFSLTSKATSPSAELITAGKPEKYFRNNKLLILSPATFFFFFQAFQFHFSSLTMLLQSPFISYKYKVYILTHAHLNDFCLFSRVMAYLAFAHQGTPISEEIPSSTLGSFHPRFGS